MVSVENFDNKNTSLLLKRIFILLEDGEFEHADRICEQVLESEPENPLAYLGKLLAELKISKKEELSTSTKNFETSRNYKRVLLYAPKSLVDEVKKHLLIVEQRIRSKKQARKNMAIRLITAIAILSVVTASTLVFAIIPAIRYIKAEEKYANGDLEEAYEIFSELGAFLDSEDRVKEIKAHFHIRMGEMVLQIPYDFGCTAEFVDNRLYLSGKSPTFEEFFKWLTPPPGKLFPSNNLLEMRVNGSSIIVSSDWDFEIPSGQITIIGKYYDDTTFRITIVS